MGDVIDINTQLQQVNARDIIAREFGEQGLDPQIGKEIYDILAAELRPFFGKDLSCSVSLPMGLSQDDLAMLRGELQRVMDEAQEAQTALRDEILEQYIEVRVRLFKLEKDLIT